MNSKQVFQIVSDRTDGAGIGMYGEIYSTYEKAVAACALQQKRHHVPLRVISWSADALGAPMGGK